MPAQPTIDSFRGAYGFLSNFDLTTFYWGVQPIQTAEHAFQALKTWVPDEARHVLTAPTPREAKRRGREVHLRPDWDVIKLGVMRDVLAVKFSQGSTLAAQLLGTGDSLLVEGNHWGDTYWGMSSIHGQWQGANWLGHLLMARRAELRAAVGA